MTLTQGKARVAPYRRLSEWLQALTELHALRTKAGWAFVDLLREGIDTFGGTEYEKAELYRLAGEQVGLTTKTLQNYCSISRKFPPERRPDGVDIGHCDAVLGLDDGQADYLLSEAVAYGMSVARVRQLAYGRMPHRLCPHCGKELT